MIVVVEIILRIINPDFRGSKITTRKWCPRVPGPVHLVPHSVNTDEGKELILVASYAEFRH